MWYVEFENVPRREDAFRRLNYAFCEGVKLKLALVEEKNWKKPKQPIVPKEE
jgi:hypothetical protein